MARTRQRFNPTIKKLPLPAFCPCSRTVFGLCSPLLLILGGIYAGIVTPTEAAAVSVFYALFVSLFIYKTVSFQKLPELLRSAVKSAAPICFLLAFATAFGRTLSLIHAADIVQNAIMTIATDKISFLIVVIIAFFLLGMVMDTGPALIILGPILCPIAESYGIDPVHLGVLMVCNLAVGLVTPPFGLNLFVTSSISGEQPMTIGKSAIPYIGVFVIALFIIAFVPQFSMLLVK